MIFEMCDRTKMGLMSSRATGPFVAVFCSGTSQPTLRYSGVLLVLIADFAAHYHIDWGKVNLNKSMGWGPTTHAKFWWLTGADQTAHQLCYLLWILWVFV